MTMIVFNITHAVEEKFDEGYDSDGKGPYWDVVTRNEGQLSEDEDDDDKDKDKIKEVLLSESPPTVTTADSNNKTKVWIRTQMLLTTTTSSYR